ncbi:aspartic peptidase domain-containing protein [Rhizoctonia solani]|nr:aspartic peptidase domain-containing protein [Rhizoctonia solani]
MTIALSRKSLMALVVAASVYASPTPINIPLTSRAIGPASGSLTDYFSGTDLQWYGNFQAGTPAQTFKVIFDTGSPWFIVPSISCGSTCTGQTAFDGTKSSTFTDLKTPRTVRFGTGGGVQPVGNLVNGGLDPLFSIYFAPKGVNNGAGELTLGGINDNRHTGSVTYFPLAFPNANLWQLNSTGLTVNGQTNSLLSTHQTWIFDSGTSNLVLPKNLTELIQPVIRPDIVPVGTLGAYGIACNKIGTLNARISVAFTGTDGAAHQLIVPSSELNVGPFNASDTSSSAMCQTLINADDQFLIGGASLLKHWYSVWDQGNARMGFAPAAH